MELSKGFKQTEAGIIPVDWNVVQVDKISSSVASGRSKQDSPFGDFPLYGSTGVIGRISKGDYSGDAILVARVGANAGQLNVVSGSYGVTDNTIILKINPNVPLRYVWRQLETKRLNSMVFGSGQPLITGTQIKGIKIPFPATRNEQEIIANALSDADAYIESLEKLIAKKRLIKKGVMKELLENSNQDVEIVPLNSLCWFQEGPGVRTHQFTDSGVKLLNGTNIKKGQLDLDVTVRYISKSEAYGPYQHFLADKDDIVIASSGITVEKFHEKVALVKSSDLPLCMNTSTIRFKPNLELLDRDFLFQYLMSDDFKTQIGGQATGSAQLNFGPFHLNRINIRKPSLEYQKNVAQILNDFDLDLETLTKKLQKARFLKQGMMQELLTGRIRLI